MKNLERYAKRRMNEALRRACKWEDVIDQMNASGRGAYGYAAARLLDAHQQRASNLAEAKAFSDVLRYVGTEK